MGRLPTIRDVARICGCSHMTVSNVLNNRSVSDSTRALVLEAMRQLNYEPSAIARGLNRKPMDTLGVVLPKAFQSPLSHPYYGPILDGIMSSTIELHKNVTIYTSSLWNEGGDGLRRYRDGRSDGLLLVTPISQPSLVHALLEVNIPFVCVGAWNDGEASGVRIDNTLAEYIVTKHLIDLGHRRIAFVGGYERGRASMRLNGYLRALDEAGVDESQRFEYHDGFVRETACAHATTIANLPAHRRPTALCCYNDEIALWMIDDLGRNGLRVPSDISVAGFDDSSEAVRANLTTMRQPMRLIGATAARMLVDILNERIIGPKTEVLDTELVVRRTTAPPPVEAS